MMEIQAPGEMQRVSAQLKREGRRIAFVPTMGALHAGHLSLIAAARKSGDFLVVSIFVNPAQFGPGEDFAAYPRDLNKDRELLVSQNVDLLFAPEAAAMFPPGFNSWLEVRGELAVGLCAKSRPGHFSGVATVVAKLFNLVRPDVVFFGQKDYQQQLVVRKMVADLNFPVEIVTVPTVREDDGLAKSSRNQYLSPAERAAAAVLFKGLQAAKEWAAGEEKDARSLKKRLTDFIKQEPLARIDYIEVVDPQTLAELKEIKGDALIALAVYIGKTRLIDNLLI